VLLALFQNVTLNAAHLIGGELTYECLGGNQYEVTLTIYRDCDQDPNCEYCADSFDDFAYIYFADQNGIFINVQGQQAIGIAFNALTDEFDVPIEAEGLCIETIPYLCISRGVYQATVTLPPRPNGYTLVYQRCCRNQTISNIIAPGSTGSTYEVYIPHTTNNCDNSSPVFNNFPPTVICEDFPLFFDHSATDLDGDSLVYSICEPFDGATANEPSIVPTSEPYPYNFIDWAAGYDGLNPLAGTPAITIDSTGFLTAYPNQTGQFVVGVCVEEWRNGVLISTNKRDFQFNVTPCQLTLAMPDADATEIAPGQFEIINCNDALVTFDNTSVGADSYFWDFGDLTTEADTSNEQFPSYLYPDTGKYEIMLIANPGQECNDTATMILSVYPNFVVDFDFETGLCEDEAFTFTSQAFSTYGNLTNLIWNFSDGEIVSSPPGGSISTPNSSGTINVIEHTFPSEGEYNVVFNAHDDLGCASSQAYVITVHPLPNINFDSTPLCFGTSVNFEAATQIPDDEILEWNWDFGDPAGGATNIQQGINVVHEFSDTLNYTINVNATSIYGCTNSQTFDIRIYPVTTAEAGPDQELCIGESIQLDGFSVGGAGQSNDFLWESANGSIANTISTSYSPTESGWVYFTSSDPNTCYDIDSLFVTVHPLPIVNAGENPAVCLGDDATLTATSPDNIIDWVWSPSSSLTTSSGASTTVIMPTDSTVFYIDVTDVNGCRNLDSVQLLIQYPVTANAQGGEICLNDSLQLLVNGGTFYEWLTNNGLENTNIANPMASPSQTTEYEVVAYNECFSDTTQVTVVVNQPPTVDAGPNQTIQVGNPITLQGSTSDDIYNWNLGEFNSLTPTDIPNPQVQPIVPSTYYLQGISDKGCLDIDSVFIDIDYTFNLLLPNAFSPNGDGINDYLSLYTLGVESINYFNIYNRWGVLVFSADNLNARWDGTYRGELQEVGVYLFTASVNKYLEGELFIKGNITLIR